MEAVPVPEQDVVSIDDVAPGIRGLRISFVNVFSVQHPDGSWTLIDAALPFSATKIKSWAEVTFSTPPNAIVLTHGHFDHVSAAGTLADEWNVPIFAHPLEFPYLTGQKNYPSPNAGAGGGMMSLLSPLLPKGPVNVADRLIGLPTEPEAMKSFVPLPGWHLLHTPGHTPGHVSFFRPTDRTLLVGDAFCTTKPESFFDASFSQPPELHGPPSYFTSDWEQARQSFQKLAALNPTIVAPGHGKPLKGSNVSEALHRLATDFENIAVPDNKIDTIVRETPPVHGD